MQKNKFLIIIVLLSLLTTSCVSVKEAFDPQRKNSSEEFLIEKKTPLSMPPDFDELPKPRNNQEVNQNQTENIEFLITQTDKKKDQTLDEENLDKDFELFVLDKIKNN